MCWMAAHFDRNTTMCACLDIEKQPLKVFIIISQNSQERNCVRVSFLKKVVGLSPAFLLQKNTQTQVFSCEICDIFKSTYFVKHQRKAASRLSELRLLDLSSPRPSALLYGPGPQPSCSTDFHSISEKLKQVA